MNLLAAGLNLIYACLGIILGITCMKYGYKMLDKLTNFNTSNQLQDGNVAVGNAIAGLFIGIGICAGLCVGLALN